MPGNKNKKTTKSFEEDEELDEEETSSNSGNSPRKRLFILLIAVMFLAVSGWGAVVYFDVSSKKTMATKEPAQKKEREYKKPSFNIERLKTLAAKKPLSKNFNFLEPESNYEEGELVVVDPPREFASEVSDLGFAIIETIVLPDLGITAMRLRSPSGQSAQSARRLLIRLYPGILVDANHHFDPSRNSN